MTLNPTLMATKIFYYPFGKRVLHWTSTADVLEALANVVTFPDRYYAKDRWTLSNPESITAKTTSAAIQAICTDSIVLLWWCSTVC